MSISENLKHIRSIIQKTALSCNRDPDSIKLLAVTKGQSVSLVREAIDAGQSDFGESYLQEALPKIEALKKFSLTWHFIGPIQSNKCRNIARNFDWVHSVCRENIALKLSQARSSEAPKLNVCIQVNPAKEKTKSGISLEDALPMAEYIQQLPHLHLRGLMLIPPITELPEKQYDFFLQLQNCLHTINRKMSLNLDTLSMGMSQDFVQAIRAGSTIVRVGRNIFDGEC